MPWTPPTTYTDDVSTWGAADVVALGESLATPLEAVEEATADPALAADTNLSAYDSTLGRAKWLRRDWVAVDEFSGTDAARILAASAIGASENKRVAFDESRLHTLAAPVDLSSVLATTDRPVRLELGSVKLEVTASITQAGIYAAGTAAAFVDLVTGVLAGDETITLPTGQGAAGAWVRGDWIAVECLTGVYGVNASGIAYGYPRELKQVLSVAGDVLTVDSAFLYAHGAAGTAKGRYQKMSMLPAPKIVGGEWTWTDPTNQPGYAIRLERCVGLDIGGYKVTNGGGSIILVDCVGGHVQADINRLVHYGIGGDAANASRGYGVGLVGACRDLDIHLTGQGCRHFFTTLANERTAATQGNVGGVPDPQTSGNYFVGGPTNIMVRGSAHNDAESTATWDTHEFGENIRFDVQAVGGNVGLQIRARGVTGKVTARGCPLAGLNLIYSSRECDIEVDISGCGEGSGGKGVGMAGIDNRVTGVVRDNYTVGVALSAHSTAFPSLRPIVEVRSENNTNYALQDLGAALPVVRNFKFPKTAGTGNTTISSPTVTSLTGRWRRGEAITGSGIPGSTTVLDISGDGRSLTLSANATATATAVALTGSQAVSILNFGASAPTGMVGWVEDGDCLGYGASSGMVTPSASIKVQNVRTDIGVVGNQPLYLGNNATAPSFDVPIYRGGAATMRVDAMVRSTKALATTNYVTTGLTSAQIDALITGVTVVDGMIIGDATNLQLLIRLGGKWYKTAALTLIA